MVRPPAQTVTTCPIANALYFVILQLIFSVFKTLTDQEVVVELKNDLSITGTLKSVDQYVLPARFIVSGPVIAC